MSAAAPPPLVTRDRTILYASAFLRALATGLIGVVLGIHLAKVGLAPAQIGVVVAAGLAGGAVATLLATFRGDRVGRRRLLIGLAMLGVAGALAAAFASDPWLLGAAAFFGMLNGMGRDRGAALAIEQALLPATAPDRDRTRVVAWYNVLQDAGHALGSLLAGLPVAIRSSTGLGELASMRACLFLYAALALVTLIIYAALSPRIEAVAGKARVVISPESRRIIVRISALFSIDSLGGGFLTTALISFYFFQRFHVSEAVIGLLFFFARLANAGSHLVAAWLSRRIGSAPR